MLSDYESMTEEINGMEEHAKRRELAFVDISGLLAARQQGAATRYGDMLKLIDDLESRQKPGRERQQQAAARQAQQAQQAQEQRAQVQVNAQAKAEPKEEAPKQEAAHRNAQVAQEMRAMISGFHVPRPKFQEIKIKNVNTKNLVLPNLQISDQVQELERIITALSDRTLDEEQVRIVRLELAGLAQHIGDLKRELEREHKSLSGLDRSLWDIRDQRLQAALELSKGGN